LRRFKGLWGQLVLITLGYDCCHTNTCRRVNKWHRSCC
jgi:hypothetical protein